MTDKRTNILSAIAGASADLRYPVEVTPETMISDLCRDSLDRVEFLMQVEERLSRANMELIIDDDQAPGLDSTVGELVDFIEKGIARG